MIFRRAFSSLIHLGLVCGAAAAMAQTTCGNTKLACLLPTALHTNPPTFNFFNQTFATQIGQLPLATPASGFIYTSVVSGGSVVYHASQESFGPLVAERFETMGRHRVYVAFVYQRFDFDKLDGNDLGSLPIVFTFQPSGSQSVQVITQTTNRIDSKLNQYVVFGSYGISNNVDVSVAVPINRVSLGVSTTGKEFSTTTPAMASFTQFLGGEASGFGDVVLAGKGTLHKSDRYGIAAGMELRLPSGDEQNFLGSGAVGIKPYFVVARRGKLAPHLNLMYQWNSRSSLNTDVAGHEQNLPGYFGYTVGADIGVKPWFTFIADLIGQHYFNAPRITTSRSISEPVNGVPMPFTTINSLQADYDLENLALGIKLNPWRKLLLIGNATTTLNNGGLRATVVPMVGASYSF